MRDEILEALVAAEAVTSADADKARALPLTGVGMSVSWLVGMGFDARAVIVAASRVSGLPLLPDKWLQRPKPPARLPAELEVFARLLAAPVGTLKGQLCVVYAEPEMTSSAAARALPEHRAFLATPADVRRILELARASADPRTTLDSDIPRLPSGAMSPLADDVPRLPSGAMSALPLADDADTVFEQPRLEEAFVTLPETEAEGAASPPPEPALSRNALEHARERALAALPRFHVRGVLGRGGMATVYLADDRGADDRGADDRGADDSGAAGEPRGTQVALKLMEPHLADDATFVERFRREVRATSSIDHPNVVRTFDAGLEGDTLYMASEYVDGGTLRDLLVGTGPMPVALVAPILLQALRGLAHAHDRGIVHRDLKPANLLLSTSGVVKVGDFGVAKSQSDNTLTQSGMLFGTPAYMSPEQAFGKPLDGRSDLFSLATLAYELLTGRNPFHHENMSTSLLLVSKVSARPLFEVCPTLPPLLEAVLSRMMERDRGLRFPDAHAAADALEPLVGAIRAHHGDVVRDAVRAPREQALRLLRAQAEAELRLAQVLLAASEPRAREAAFRLFKSQRLDADNPASASFLRQLCQTHGFTFDLEPDDKIRELEDALAKKPDSPALLRRGAELLLARHNLLGAVVWMRRYARAQPGDLHMAHALASILGTDPLAPFTPPAAGTAMSDDAGLSIAREPGRAPLVLPAFAAKPGQRAPLVTGESDDTAYVRAAPAGPLSRLARRPLALFAFAAVVLGGLISVPLLFSRDDGAVTDDPAAGAASTGSASADDLLHPDPARQKARLDVQRRKIAESQALAERGQLADATAALDAAIAEDPGSELAVDALLARARIYVNLRRMADARVDLEKVTKMVDETDARALSARKLLSGL